MVTVKHFFGWYVNDRGIRQGVSWLEEDGVPLSSFEAKIVQIREVSETEAYDLDDLMNRYPYKENSDPPK